MIRSKIDSSPFTKIMRNRFPDLSRRVMGGEEWRTCCRDTVALCSISHSDIIGVDAKIGSQNHPGSRELLHAHPFFDGSFS